MSQKTTNQTQQSSNTSYLRNYNGETLGEPGSIPEFPVPDGWHPFGTLIYESVSDVEFSNQLGQDFLPNWERVKL